MAWDEEEDTQTYRVIVDGGKQVSLFPADRKIPLGWKDAGYTGKKRACLDRIEEVWTDRRLVNVRR
jgi:MbtH protein